MKVCVCLVCFSLVPVHLGKGQWLARQIQSLQMRRRLIGVLESQSFLKPSEYFSDDESDDSFHISLDSSVLSTFDDMESNGKKIAVFTAAEFCLLVLSAMMHCTL